MRGFSGCDEADGGEVGGVAAGVAGEERVAENSRMGSDKKIGKDIGASATAFAIATVSLSSKEGYLEGNFEDG